MKRYYAEQINKLLEDYHFNNENNPQSQPLHFAVMANGIQHLNGLAFCSQDTEAAEALRPYLCSVLNDEVPQPVYLGVSI